MNEPFYEFRVLDEALRFEFLSISDQKTIKKIVRYTETNIAQLYNLSLTDLLDDGTESDMVISNNQDMEIILATVFRTFHVFLTAYPACQIFFMGSTPVRTRLYQIAVTRELTNALEVFDIKGLTDTGFEQFVVNKPYQAFVFSLK
ncbi:DUF6934 family protein [Arundinibacter roseus]|uniref:Uncharacterized protein n=1 Tax=Arundinibacter roseus TaxID=2070510 RepID=A0A4R4K389_9BACT|nr:hypothetical protein [Arundinibacter roseus]TDB61778.1 hypothetical protein EZE20_18700 [Arundinibacter roseus]